MLYYYFRNVFWCNKNKFMGLELDQPSTLLNCVLVAGIQASFDCLVGIIFSHVFHIYSTGPDIHCDNDIIQCLSHDKAISDLHLISELKL